MKRTTFLAVAAVAVLAVAALPLYIAFWLSPALSSFMEENVEMEAMRVCRHLASMFVPDGTSIDRDSLTPEFHRMSEQVLDQFSLKKVKLFTASGEIIYSTDKADIGEINHKSYFHNIVAKGNNYTKMVIKDHETLEGKIMHAHVVETYVPIFQKGKFVGAFEIYYDVTGRHEKLDSFIRGLYAGIAALVAVLIGALFFSLRQAMRGLAGHQAAVQELRLAKENFEKTVAQKKAEMEEQLARVRTLRGVLPLCGSCGRVKGESGVWQELAPYISSHTEAECTNDLCPECEKRIHEKMRMSVASNSAIN